MQFGSFSVQVLGGLRMLRVIAFLGIVLIIAFVMKLLHEFCSRKTFYFLKWFIFCSYFMSVLYITIFSRPTGSEMKAKLGLFRPFRESFSLHYTWPETFRIFVTEGMSSAIHLRSNEMFPSMLLNIIMFIPMGNLIPYLVKKAKIKYACVIAGIVSLAIEMIQYFSMRGCFETDDLITNILGAFIGYILYKCIE